MKKLVFVCAAVAMTGTLTSLATSPAMAGDRQQVIETDAYNLSSSAGHAAIAARIASAGRSVCGYADGRDTRANREFQACQAAAVTDGMDQLARLSRRGSVTIGASD